MHNQNPFNLYPPNYIEIAQHDSNLQEYLVYRDKKKNWASIRYKDPESLRQLTLSLLRTYFDITLDIPLDSLVPTVPGRCDYILWCGDLVKDLIEKRDSIWALDIGTGHSCIYPLIGREILGGYWKGEKFVPKYLGQQMEETAVNFIATDENQRALEYARKNVERNERRGEILVVENNLIPFKEMKTKGQFLFSMCNPPFYDQPEKDGEYTQTRKRRKPSGVNTGSKHELIYQDGEGGDYGFLLRLIRTSSEEPDCCVWWTCLLGRKSSLERIVKDVKEGKEEVFEKMTEWKTGTLQTGRTVRWVFAWSFTSSNISEDGGTQKDESQTQELNN